MKSALSRFLLNDWNANADRKAWKLLSSGLQYIKRPFGGTLGQGKTTQAFSRAKKARPKGVAHFFENVKCFEERISAPTKDKRAYDVSPLTGKTGQKQTFALG